MAFESYGALSYLQKCFFSGMMLLSFVLDVSVLQKERLLIQKGPVCAFHFFKAVASILLFI